MSSKILVFTPTYNERGNVTQLFYQILSLGLENVDVLFIDDNSPDGTGELLDELSSKHEILNVLHRPAKLGIGSAHLRAINWAYENEYDILITMDSDFTHPPAYIRNLINSSSDYDLVIASRYLEKNSLEDWNLFRRTLTVTGHLVTSSLLKLNFDATGAFRLYKLKNIDRNLFHLVRSNGYSFFIESLFILNYNKVRITEIPIKLPARYWGHSKMKFSDGLKTVSFLISLYFSSLINRNKFKAVGPG
jgi:dolichol-phosphate mannosyltransferase